MLHVRVTSPLHKYHVRLSSLVLYTIYALPIRIIKMITDSFLQACIAATFAQWKGTSHFSSASMRESFDWLETSPSHQSKEARAYYAGLSSDPHLVGRSGIIPWEEPSGPEAYPRRKMLGTVGRHAIKDIWENHLSLKIIEHLNSKNVAWTSIDVLRIGYVDESPLPVIVWIGVKPKSLSFEDGTEIARSCQQILVQFGIIDVDVEIRSSLVTPLKGPKLLAPKYSFDPIVDIQNPLDHTSGIPVSCCFLPESESTGGFFVAEGGDSKRLFLVTSRHGVFEPDKNEVFDYESPSTPRRDIMLLSDMAFKKFLESIQAEIGGNSFNVTYLEKRVNNVRDLAGDKAEEERKHAEKKLAETKEAMEALNTFYWDVSTHWASPDDRMLGHVIYSPPIEFGFGTGKCTQDFAIIEIDLSKIDATTFKGNVIDLGPMALTRMMRTNSAHFEYPGDRLLRLKGTIPDEEMRYPPALDQNGEPCLIVLKHGRSTGLTVGRANDVRSCVCNYYKDGTTYFSMEWAILPLNDKSLPFSDKSDDFSAPGDSGAVVADGQGRIGGIIISGAGSTQGKDITYATSINSIMQGIKAKFPNAHLNPDLRAT